MQLHTRFLFVPIAGAMAGAMASVVAPVTALENPLGARESKLAPLLLPDPSPA
jgi:hypothetical protein